MSYCNIEQLSCLIFGQQVSSPYLYSIDKDKVNQILLDFGSFTEHYSALPLHFEFGLKHASV